MQGAWGAKDIFNEMAEQYVTRVNEMAGGRLRIDYLVAGSVVKPFEVMDATSKGVIDAAHTVAGVLVRQEQGRVAVRLRPDQRLRRQPDARLDPPRGHASSTTSWCKKLGLDVVGFFAMPMPTQPLGWFKKPIKGAADLKGLKYRTVGLAADLMQELGCKVTQLPGGEIVPAMERGVIDAFEFNNPTSDRRFGAQDVAKNYMMGSYHQAMEFFEIDLQQEEVRLAAEGSAGDPASTAPRRRPRRTTRWRWTSTRSTCRSSRTRTRSTSSARRRTIFAAQLKAWDVLVKKLSDEDPFFKKVWESQKAWAKRVGYYYFFNDADYKQAYEHICTASSGSDGLTPLAAS